MLSSYDFGGVMIMAIRVTQHNGRTGKKGTYLAKHNDRKFNSVHADHIDESKSVGNVYWSLYEGMSFEDCEKKYYDDRFGTALALQNEKYEKKRQYCYMRSMDDYRKSPKTCPEEQLIYIGNKDNNVGASMLQKIVEEQIQWEQKTYPNVVILNYALHVDEQGAPHIHKRQVWEATDKNGNMVVSQTKALKQMGVGTDKKGTRYDNAKQVYTAECREHFEGLCRQYGIELETERLEASKVGLAIDDYKANQAKERERMADIRAVEAEKRAELAESKLSIAERGKKGLEAKIEGLELVLAELRLEKKEAEDLADNAKKEVKNLEKKIESLVLIAKKDGYQMRNEQLKECIEFFKNKQEDKGFFGFKGTYTLSWEEFQYIGDTLNKLDYTTRDLLYTKQDNQKKSQQIDELVKRCQKAEEALASYQRIKANVSTFAWNSVVEEARQNIRHKQIAMQEQLTRMRNSRGKSNGGIEM